MNLMCFPMDKTILLRCHVPGAQSARHRLCSRVALCYLRTVSSRNAPRVWSDLRQDAGCIVDVIA